MEECGHRQRGMRKKGIENKTWIRGLCLVWKLKQRETTCQTSRCLAVKIVKGHSRATFLPQNYHHLVQTGLEKINHSNHFKKTCWKDEQWHICIQPVDSVSSALTHADTLISYDPWDTPKKTNTYTQTQPNFAAPWHKMGFLCLSRGGPMATEGHIKRWGLYNRWCQIGCQLQHKWLSITSAPHVKRPLYRRLDFRRHRESLLSPAHSAALQEGSPQAHTDACTFMHTCTR